MMTRDKKPMSPAELVARANGRGVPFVVVRAEDQQGMVFSIYKELKEIDGVTVRTWDFTEGFQLVGTDDPGSAPTLVECQKAPWDAMKAIYDATRPAEDTKAQRGTGTVVVLPNAHRYLKDIKVTQPMCNARENLKAGFCTIVLLIPLGETEITIPPELENDIVQCEESLPDMAETRDITQRVYDDFNTTLKEEGLKTIKAKPKDLDRWARSVSGLGRFPTEQYLSLNLDREGMNEDGLFEAKRMLVNETKGFTLYENKTTFADLGGLGHLKSKTDELFANAWLFAHFDEIGRSVASAEGDSAGVNADITAQLLQFMEEFDCLGLLLGGIPGTGKTAFSQSLGGQYNTRSACIDLGATKGKYVGETEGNARKLFRVAEAIGGRRIVVVATSNTFSNLPGALLGRFTDTFFFDVPTQEQLAPVWDIWMNKFNLEGDIPELEMAVPRDVHRICLKARCMAENKGRPVSPAEAAHNHVPSSRKLMKDISDLRDEAHETYLDVNEDGLFSKSRRKVLQSEPSKRSHRTG